MFVAPALQIVVSENHTKPRGSWESLNLTELAIGEGKSLRVEYRPIEPSCFERWVVKHMVVPSKLKVPLALGPSFALVTPSSNLGYCGWVLPGFTGLHGIFGLLWHAARVNAEAYSAPKEGGPGSSQRFPPSLSGGCASEIRRLPTWSSGIFEN